MSEVTKIYTAITEKMHTAIGKCAAVLPNKLQCWRAADVVVEVTTGEGEDRMTKTYQLCHAHASLEKHNDAHEAAKAAEEATPIAAPKPLVQAKK